MDILPQRKTSTAFGAAQSDGGFVSSGVTIDAMHRILPDFKCMRCKRSLKGLPATGSCPGCGHTVAQSLKGHGVCKVDEQGLISEHVQCRGCGIDLSGSPAGGACPQCGAQTWRSFTLDLLRYMPKSWLNTVAGSILGLLIAMSLFYPLTVSISVVIAASSMLSFSTAKVLTYILICLALIEVMYVVFVFMLTRPGPAETQFETSRLWRNLLRWLSIAAIVLNSISAFSMMHSSNLSAAMSYDTSPLAMLVDSLNQALFVLIMFYVARLAWIIPDANLSRNCRLLGYAYALTEIVCLAVGIAAAAHVTGHPHPAGNAGGGQNDLSGLAGSGISPDLINALEQSDTGQSFASSSLGCVAELVLLCLNIWGWVLLWRFRRALQEGVFRINSLSKLARAQVKPAVPR